MKPVDLDIKHGTKKKKPIFSIDVSKTAIATGSQDGEVCLWTLDGAPIQKIEKHTGAVLCVRFSHTGFLASGADDNLVIVYDDTGKMLYQHSEHTSDVSNVIWTPANLISVGYDGHIVWYSKDGSVIEKKIKAHNGQIRGISSDSACTYICTQGEDSIVIYKNQEIVKSIPVSEGIILEAFFSRISCSPDGSLIACGLSFNGKNNTVEIYNNELENKFSLVGHVAPCEIVAFNPSFFMGDRMYMVIAVASQDLSISLWTTLKAFPFLLIKNASQLPILDMRWNDQGSTLFISTYDGSVRKFEFDAEELGKRIEDYVNEECSDIYFSVDNIILKKKYDEALKKLESGEGAEFLAKSAKKKESKKEQTGDLEETKVQLKNESDKNNPIVVSDGKKESTVKKPEESKVKRKKIKPILVEDGAVDIGLCLDGKNTYIFNHFSGKKIPAKNTEPFSKKIKNFTIELNNAMDKIQVKRANKNLYTIGGKVHLLCYSKKFICVYTTHLQIYYLETGNLVLPYIGTIGVAFIDIKKSKIMYLEVDGSVHIIDTKKMMKITNTKVPKIDGLTSIYLSKRYYMVCEYVSEKYFYSTEMDAWFLLKKEWNDITTESTDFTNCQDETLDRLEHEFMCYMSVKNYEKARRMVRRITNHVVGCSKLTDYLENKVRRLLEDLADVGYKKFVLRMLEKINSEFSAQAFVIDMMKGLDIPLKRRKR